VFVINKEGKSEMRPVKVGEWHGDDWIINQGLAAGDVVVTDGVLKLAPGATVKIVAAPTPAPAAPAPAQPAPAEAKPAKVGDNEVPKN
jgi:membrane fusion protein (multidrug efflux system)